MKNKNKYKNNRSEKTVKRRLIRASKYNSERLFRKYNNTEEGYDAVIVEK